MKKLPFERVISTSRKESFGCKRNVRVLAVKVVEETRYMVRGFEENEKGIDVTSIQKRFESRRAVVKP